VREVSIENIPRLVSDGASYDGCKLVGGLY